MGPWPGPSTVTGVLNRQLPGGYDVRMFQVGRPPSRHPSGHDPLHASRLRARRGCPWPADEGRACARPARRGATVAASAVVFTKSPSHIHTFFKSFSRARPIIGTMLRVAIINEVATAGRCARIDREALGVCYGRPGSPRGLGWPLRKSPRSTFWPRRRRTGRRLISP